MKVLINKNSQNCKLCGKAIKQYGKAHGYCNSCKEDIMRKWTQVPFDTRCEILDIMENSNRESSNV